jgi:acetyltransferase
MGRVESEDTAYDRAAVEDVIQKARTSGRTLLTEFESKRILSAYGIPTVATLMARSETAAVKAAGEIGYPVVVKLLSETITHKSDLGGVRLNLCSARAVAQAFREIRNGLEESLGPEHFHGVTVQPMVEAEGCEIILGSTVDSQLGPVLLFGSGGRMVEVYRDRSVGLPPLNSTLARRMMEQTRVFAALSGLRGQPPVDIAALEQLLVNFSSLVVEHPWIREIDINPIMASAKRLVAVDARIVLYGSDVKLEDIPKPVIRPYPARYIAPWEMKDGTPVNIRPIRPEDEPMMVRFHETLSERSVYFRYFHPMRLNVRVAHERLTRMCFIDYSREIALVAERTESRNGGREILAVGRLVKLRGGSDGEFAIVVSDNWQHRGLGKELLRRLVVIGREEKLRRIVADVLPDNHEMLRVCEHLGFKQQYWIEGGVVKVTLDL